MRLALSPLTLAIRTAFNGPTLDLNFDGRPLDPRITFTRASAATRVNQQGLIETVGTDVPRIDYDPVTLQPRGLLVEEQRTNLLLWSNDFTNAAWLKFVATTTAGASLSPSGAVNATRLTAPGSGPYASIYQTVTAANGAPHTLAVFAKANATNQFTLEIRGTSGNVYDTLFTLSGAGTATNNPSAVGSPAPGIRAVGNGWYLCWVTKTTTNTAPINIIGFGHTSAPCDVFIYQADLQPGSFITSPIPTTTAQATRAADIAVMTGANFSSWFNAAQGTMFAEGLRGNDDSPQKWAYTVSDGTANNRIGSYLAGTNADGSRVVGGAVALLNTQASLTVPVGGVYRTAIAFSSAGAAYVANGSARGSTATNAAGISVNKLDIGSQNGGGYFNGHIRRLSFYPRAMSASELQAITA